MKRRKEREREKIGSRSRKREVAKLPRLFAPLFLESRGRGRGNGFAEITFLCYASGDDAVVGMRSERARRIRKDARRSRRLREKDISPKETN